LCGRLLRLGGLFGGGLGLLGSLLLNGCGCLFSCGLFNLLGYLLSGSCGSNLLDSWLLLDSLLQLVVNLVQVLLAGRDLVALVELSVVGGGGGRGWLGDTVGRRRLLLLVLILLGLLGKVAEDVVEDEIAVGLLGKDKGLDEALVGLALVGDFANDLDDDIGIGALRVDVGDTDLGVLEVELLDALIDGLYLH
jgi:hypothetical protein